MISFKNTGNWSKTFKFLDNILEQKYVDILEKYAIMGRNELIMCTPIKTGKTANSWEYEISYEHKGDFKQYSIIWYNKNVVDKGEYKVNVAVLLQYGHATRNGGWVQGIDYINPALKPIFDRLADAAWGEVTKA